MKHKISAGHLTQDKIDEIITRRYTLELGADSRERILHCREYLDRKIRESKEPIYGVTTGFGSLCKISIDADQLAQLQINLMMSHACGTGERVPNQVVKITTTTSTRWYISRGLLGPLATWCPWLICVCPLWGWVRWNTMASS